LQEGYGLELVVDDQDFTHDSLRQGEVLGCVTTVSRALKGCRVVPLGVMRYVAVASPDFVARTLKGTPAGLNAATFSQVPFLVFNRKDDMQRQWVARAFGLQRVILRQIYVPSSEGQVTAAQRGGGRDAGRARASWCASAWRRCRPKAWCAASARCPTTTAWASPPTA